MVMSYLAMRSALFGAVGVLLSIEGIGVGDPVLWYAFLGMTVAGMIGADEVRADVYKQHRDTSVDNSSNH
ncbi:hypothetical protein [Massilia timonae]|uniref:hypothetical protein n=1 Tax=Massilia timonae TaxID=47229 RepID=UPI0023521CCE|nr:hypothetical protein [Massilia timonae]